MLSEPPKLVTAGVIAERIGVPLHRVQLVLATRPHIKPKARAGTLRLYDNDAVAAVRHELNAIDARRATRKGVTPTFPPMRVSGVTQCSGSPVP